MSIIPFGQRRSMRPIKNEFIQVSEQAGHEDINTWIQYLIEVEFREAKMAENIKELRAKLLKYEGKKDDETVDKIIKASK